MSILKFPKVLLSLMLILPWFSLPLLGKRDVKKYLPAALCISLVVRIVHFIAKRKNWWHWEEKLHPKLSGEFPLMWGPYLIGSMWILKLTYGRFVQFLLLNLFVDSLFTFVLVDFFKKRGIVSLVRLKKWGLALIFFIDSLLLYGFQYIKDKGK
ncbi:hypothetical protein [Priestia filamentosa]|uniref:hypothetical protein n=1 Tax=Priestia filamentosa TaxID=1402861 RepID=UPI0003095293|nr:hypothetical protein [Priestia filamentosa]RJS63592.1 hypothetical protein CJ485_02160 [Priestia filamentosa]